MTKYRKKPVIVEAIQFFDNPETIAAISELVGKTIRVDYADPDNPVLRIQTLEGIMTANVGDRIIKGVKGEIYPCKPLIFGLTYDRVEEPTDA